jgi:hypothetical protein
METKLTVRVPRHLVENAKRHAKKNNTTLSELISAYLQNLPSEDEELAGAPVVRRLTGILSPEVSPRIIKSTLERNMAVNDPRAAPEV